MVRSKFCWTLWLPVLLWMGLIFGASTDVLSSQHTSRVIGPILRWMKPDISDETVHNIQVVVRKSGHLSEYAVLALLLYRAIRRTFAARNVDVWCLRSAIWAWSIATVYAATDEWHQSFVPSRGSSVHDVIIDSTGAALGLCLAYRWHLSRQQRELQRQH